MTSRHAQSKNKLDRLQCGSIIIFALLMLIVILTIAGALIDVFLPKIRIVTDAVRSTVAIFAADTGSEVCLYEARTQSPPIDRSTLLTNGATFSLASLSASLVDITNDCRPLGQESFRFRAVGTYGTVSRALEVSQ